MSADDVAKAFIPHYYNLFDTNREGLVALFRETSTLTFEGDGPKTGPAAIMEKLRALPPVPRRRHDRRVVAGARFCVPAARAPGVPESGRRDAGPAQRPDDRDPAVREPERDPRLLHRANHGASRRRPFFFSRAASRGAAAAPRACSPTLRVTPLPRSQIEAGKPLKYSEVFQLVASAPGQYYLNNVMFRFNYA